MYVLFTYCYLVCSLSVYLYVKHCMVCLSIASRSPQDCCTRAYHITSVP